MNDVADIIKKIRSAIGVDSALVTYVEDIIGYDISKSVLDVLDKEYRSVMMSEVFRICGAHDHAQIRGEE